MWRNENIQIMDFIRDGCCQDSLCFAYFIGLFEDGFCVLQTILMMAIFHCNGFVFGSLLGSDFWSVFKYRSFYLFLESLKKCVLFITLINNGYSV